MTDVTVHPADRVRGEVREAARVIVRASGLALKSAFPALGRQVGVSPSRVKDLYYGAAATIHAWEADEIRRLRARIDEIEARRRAGEDRAREILGG
ncbi:hypothetical protein [Zavarzinia aquatilis]|uniref:Uncharacterized protein n=1 Tax=Zavarzinia aquatilis TaxID=2211142 RepID=A0A317EGM1_9PROT|nr:hypothetical protein [Zavarzinia aquatilis]PWR24553.1 hypothetical protein DKG74_07040 [Zavarzinia aquatilis]